MRATLTACVVAAVAVTLSTPAAPAQAAGLNLSGFVDMVVDPAHGHVFISQGDDTVVVTDLEGAPLTPLTFMGGGARGLALSEDGATLYVALNASDTVAAVDSSTLTLEASYPVSDGSCPDDLAVTLGWVWISGTCFSSFGLEPEATPVQALNPINGNVTGNVAPYGLKLAELSTSPSNTNSIWARLGPTVLRFDVAVTTSPQLTVGASLGFENRVDQLALTPDGQRIVVAVEDSAFEDLRVLDSGDLSPVGIYLGRRETPRVGVAIRGDGLVAAALWGSPQIHMYAPGVEAPFFTSDVSDTSPTPYPGGLAFGPGNLYVVSFRGGGTKAVLNVLQVPTLNLTGPRAAETGDTVTVSARLFSDSPNQELAIYAKTAGSPRRLVGSGPVDGALTLSTPVKVTKTTRFTVEYTGDLTHPAESSTLDLPVKAKVAVQPTGGRGRLGGIYRYRLGSIAKIRASVAPDHRGECVQFRADVYTWRWVTIRKDTCARLRAGSMVTVPIPSKPSYRNRLIRVHASWARSPENARASSAYRYLKFQR